MGDSRAKKILIRTLVGGGLVAILALALWWVAETDDGAPVVVAGWCLAVLGGYELQRLGTFRGCGLGWVVVPAILATGWEAWNALDLSESALMLRNQGSWWGSGASGGSRWIWVFGGFLGAVKGVRVPFSTNRHLLWALLLVMWATIPLLGLHDVWFSFGVQGLIAILILSKIGDIAGYYVGNAMGRTHPFPNISPGKTTAGCVGSLVVGIVAGGVCVAVGLLPGGRWGIVGGCLAGLIVNLAAQGGDLFESWVKRQAGVKDSGTWFGPSGGVLDLVDSLLFSVPLARLTWPLLFPGGWFPDS